MFVSAPTCTTEHWFDISRAWSRFPTTSQNRAQQKNQTERRKKTPKYQIISFTLNYECFSSKISFTVLSSSILKERDFHWILFEGIPFISTFESAFIKKKKNIKKSVESTKAKIYDIQPVIEIFLICFFLFVTLAEWIEWIIRNYEKKW